MLTAGINFCQLVCSLWMQKLFVCYDKTRRQLLTAGDNWWKEVTAKLLGKFRGVCPIWWQLYCSLLAENFINGSCECKNCSCAITKLGDSCWQPVKTGECKWQQNSWANLEELALFGDKSIAHSLLRTVLVTTVHQFHLLQNSNFAALGF